MPHGRQRSQSQGSIQPVVRRSQSVGNLFKWKRRTVVVSADPESPLTLHISLANPMPSPTALQNHLLGTQRDAPGTPTPHTRSKSHSNAGAPVALSFLDDLFDMVPVATHSTDEPLPLPIIVTTSPEHPLLNKTRSEASIRRTFAHPPPQAPPPNLPLPDLPLPRTSSLPLRITPPRTSSINPDLQPKRLVDSVAEPSPIIRSPSQPVFDPSAFAIPLLPLPPPPIKRSLSMNMSGIKERLSRGPKWADLAKKTRRDISSPILPAGFLASLEMKTVPISPSNPRATNTKSYFSPVGSVSPTKSIASVKSSSSSGTGRPRSMRMSNAHQSPTRTAAPLPPLPLGAAEIIQAASSIFRPPTAMSIRSEVPPETPQKFSSPSRIHRRNSPEGLDELSMSSTTRVMEPSPSARLGDLRSLLRTPILQQATRFPAPPPRDTQLKHRSRDSYVSENDGEFRIIGSHRDTAFLDYYGEQADSDDSSSSEYSGSIGDDLSDPYSRFDNIGSYTTRDERDSAVWEWQKAGSDETHAAMHSVRWSTGTPDISSKYDYAMESTPPSVGRLELGKRVDSRSWLGI
ncbi:hypothetical protein RQP46_000814 [Phenoliferia psychrophenolica]